MVSSYPNIIDIIPDVIDNQTEVKAIVVNNVKDAVISTQRELGLDPSREFGTVRARLDSLDTRISDLRTRIEALEAGGGGGGFTAGGDLSGSISSQQVLAITGSGGIATLRAAAETLKWADGISNPTLTQSTTTAAGSTLSVIGQASSANVGGSVNVVGGSGAGANAGGNISISGGASGSAAGGDIVLTPGVGGTNGAIRLEGSTVTVVMDEVADHGVTPVASKGLLWLKNTTPNTLYFTDDTGTDYQLGQSSSQTLSQTLAFGAITGGTGGSHTIQFSSADNVELLGDGVNFSITYPSAATTTAGGAISITSQTGGTTTDAGGALSLSSGVGGAAAAAAAGAGGLVSVLGGVGGAGNGSFAAGAGGGASMIAGNAGSNGGGGGNAGGVISISAGNSSGSSAGPAVNITGGAGAGSGSGGVISITGGASSGAGQAGNISITGGACSSNGLGGNVNINAGNSSTGTDGDINIGISNTDQITLGNATNNTTFFFPGTGAITIQGANRQIRLDGGGATSGGNIRIQETTTDPTATSNYGYIYTKDVSTVTELFYRSSNGTVYQLTPISGGGYATIQDEGTPLTQETVIDFQGAGVTASAGSGKTIVTIPGGSSLTAPANPADDGKLTIASGGDLTYATSASGLTGLTFASGVINWSANEPTIQRAGTDVFFTTSTSTYIRGVSTSGLNVNGTTRLEVSAASLTISVGPVNFAASVVTPKIAQTDETGASATGDTLTIQAQNATGTTSTGGAFIATSGTGTTTAGQSLIQTGGTTQITVNPNSTNQARVGLGTSFGGAFSTDAILGIPKLGRIVSLNNAGTGDLSIMVSDSSDNLYFGNSTGVAVSNLWGGSGVVLRVSGTNCFNAAAATLTIGSNSQVLTQNALTSQTFQISGTTHVSITELLTSTVMPTAGTLNVGGAIYLGGSSLSVPALLTSGNTLVVGSTSVSSTQVNCADGAAILLQAGPGGTTAATYDFNLGSLSVFDCSITSTTLQAPGGTLTFDAPSTTYFKFNGTSKFEIVSATTIAIRADSFQWGTPQAPDLNVFTNTSGTGTLFTVRAQDISGAATVVGGKMFIRAGDCTNSGAVTSQTGGELQLRAGNSSGSSGTRIGGAVNIASGTGAAAANDGEVTISRGAVNILFTSSTDTILRGPSNCGLNVAGTNRFYASSSVVTMNVPTLLIQKDQLNPLIYQQDESFAGATGDTLTVRAQTMSAATGTNTGGRLVLESGSASATSGTGTAGNVEINTGVSASTGLDGGIKLQLAQTRTMVEAVEIAASRNVLALVRGSALTTTQMPASTGDRVIYIENCATPPTANSVGGPIMYAESGALKARGTSGTTTTMAAADPHCPTCGNDYVFEAKNDKRNHHLAICWSCFLDECELKGLDRSTFAFIDKLK